jgi:hypothetical protein
VQQHGSGAKLLQGTAKEPTPMKPEVEQSKQKKIGPFCYEGGSCGTLLLVPAQIDTPVVLSVQFLSADGAHQMRCRIGFVDEREASHSARTFD